MHVNLKKTKVIIFQKPSNKQPTPNFLIENKALQVTQEYKNTTHLTESLL
jgi:hypothetical protein